jgi:putative methionine-R-sulfoxide reductase with GAF domain
MYDELLNFYDMSPISQELPNLISETDPNAQALKIENLLDKHFYIDGFAVSIVNDDSIVRHSNEKIIHEDLLKKLDELLLNEQEGVNTGEHSVVPFKANEGEISEIAIAENTSPILSDANGIAFYMNGKELKGCMYLLSDNRTINIFSSDLMKTEKFISLISSLFTNSYRHFHSAEKMRFFNLYETVSSALGYVGDLQELLTTIISIVTSELPSEEGSVLLLDDETNELEFFSAIGETGFGLTQLRFPADKGIAGYALQNREAIIVDNVQTCPHFFKSIDEDSGFETKSILAVPLISGKECIGVIEAVNKIGRDSFDEQDKRILMAIADEVALAIKNARLFDYVVDSYCNIRRGDMTCKGCVRPLKSWTPCAKQLDKV